MVIKKNGINLDCIAKETAIILSLYKDKQKFVMAVAMLNITK